MPIVALVLASLPLFGCRAESVSERLAALEYRPLLGRLSLDTGYSECRPERRTLIDGAGCVANGPLLVRRLCSPPPQPDGQVFRILREWPPATRPGVVLDLHQRPLRDLLWQSVDRLDETVQRLEMAAIVAGEAEALSDLAAARIEMALVGDRPAELLAAWVAAERALERSPRYAPARFNRALALDRLGMKEAAAIAWRTALEVEPEGPWADEARHRITQLVEPSGPQRWTTKARPALESLLGAVPRDPAAVGAVVADHPQRAREFLQQNLLPSWAEEEEPAAASRRLAAAEELAAALARVTGDSLLLRDVEQLRALGGLPAETDARLAHRLLSRGYEALYRDWHPSSARTALEEASRLFQRLKSPQALWARLLLALTDYYEQRHERALVELDAVAPAAAASPILAARVAWIRGLVGSALGDLQMALDGYRAALEGFCSTGERENQAVMNAYLSHSMSELGHTDAAWRHRYLALSGLDEVATPVRRYAILETLVMNLHAEGDERGALLLANEQVQAAQRDGGAPLRQSALMRRAAIRQSLGDATGARADLETARRASLDIDDPALRARVESDQDLLAAELASASEPAKAIALANSALSSYRATDFLLLEPRALAARGRAREALGQLEGALADYRAEVEILERRGETLSAELDRGAFKRQMSGAYDRTVHLLAMQLNRPFAAMVLTEHARAWPPPPGLRRATRPPQLPEGTALVRYALLGDALCAWAVARDELVQHCAADVRDQLEASVYRLITSLAAHPVGDSRHMAAAVRLSDLLLRPVARLLRPANKLIVVVDGPIALVPFAALRVEGHLLVETHDLVFAQSAWNGSQARDPSGTPGSTTYPGTGALAVWTSSAPGIAELPPLPRSLHEAKAVAAAYAGGVSVDGRRLGRERLLARLPTTTVLHFAGHAAGPAGSGDLQLILDPTPGGERIGTRDLEGQRFPALQLVYLSACRSAGIGPQALPGPLSLLAHRFLQAGAQAVVGSSWDVSDRTAHDLAIRFHRAYAGGLTPAAALRQVQLEQLARQLTGDWAFLRVYAT